MAFTLEDGTGVTGANAYAAIATVETYYTDRNYTVTNWSALNDAGKQACIVRASQYLDGKYGSRFVGVKYRKDQGLEWPRWSAYDRNGFLCDADAVPSHVEFATAELALKIADDTDLLPDIAAGTGVIRKVDQVGAIKQEREYSDAYSGRQPVFGLVEAILFPVLAGGNETILVRA